MVAGGVAEHYVVSYSDAANRLADAGNDPGAFMAEDRRHRHHPGVVAHHGVGMADAGGDNFH